MIKRLQCLMKQHGMDFMRRFFRFLSMIVLIVMAFVPLAAPEVAHTPVEKPSLMLATLYTPETTDPQGWLVSEKLDGVRGYWTGSRMVSRSGHGIPVPVWFTEDFPPFPLDGELWLGRGRFSEMSGIARKEKAGDAWKQVRYAVFDAPSGDLGFEERIDTARRWFAAHPSAHVMIVEQIRCEGREHLSRMLTDAEAKVVGYVGGQGKYQGKMGALLVELPGGLRFSIGTGFTDTDREHPPPLGCTVTFKYKEINPSGIPRFASFLRVRDDL